MRRPRVSKLQAELAIVERFADAYFRKFGARLDDLTHRDKPDFSAVDSATHQTLGIEVTGVYQDEREAEINYWLEGEWGTIVGNFDALIANINRALVDKADKASSYEPLGPLVLAIWIGSFVFNHDTDMRFMKPRLKIPANPFSLIALVLTDEHSQEPVLHLLHELPSWRQTGSA
jgi:hypothetical protein